MKLQFKKRRFIPVAIAMAAVIAVSGVAYAYWTATGGGTGTAAAANGVTDLVVTQSAVPADALSPMYPGDSAQVIKLVIKNNSAQSVHPMSVSASVTGTNQVGCGAGDFLVGAAAPVDQAIAAGGSLAVNGPTIQFNNKPSVDQSACKGATVNLAFTIP